MKIPQNVIMKIFGSEAINIMCVLCMCVCVCANVNDWPLWFQCVCGFSIEVIGFSQAIDSIMVACS